MLCIGFFKEEAKYCAYKILLSYLFDFIFKFMHKKLHFKIFILNCNYVSNFLMLSFIIIIT